MFKRITLTLALLAAAMSLMAQDRYVDLNDKNFPDANFRNYLGTQFKNNVKDNKLDVTAINTINLNFNSSKYTKIKSLEGIKLLFNLQKLILPATIAPSTTYSLGDLDVSGMPNLESVTNMTKIASGSTPYYVKGDGINTSETFKASKNSMTKFTAIDCPKLKEVNLAGYKKLKAIELGGSTLDAITDLYVSHTGLEKLDISQMPNLFNHAWSNGTDDYWTEYDASTTDAMVSMEKNYSSFSVDNCADLTEFIIGEHPFKAICISGATKLKSIDLSGLPDLVRFQADFGPLNNSSNYGESGERTKYTCNHIYTHNVKGALEEVIIGKGHKHFRYFQCIGANLTSAKVDFENLASTIIEIHVPSNKLTTFDVESFPLLEYCDLGYNRIHHLGVLPNPEFKKIEIMDNCLTWIPQFTDGVNPYYDNLNHTKMFQHVRKGRAYRYRIVEDPDDVKYIETADDGNNQKYYWNMYGGHVGNPANDETMFGKTPTGRKEDPRYFYFDSPLTDGFYWYRNPHAYKNKVSSH